MNTLKEILARKEHRDNKSVPKRREEHRKSERHKENRKESKDSKKEGHKKQEFKYPLIKLETVAEKVGKGFSYKSAKSDDYKDKNKTIVTIKLPKIGYTPFVETPPKDDSSDPTVKVPTNLVGDKSTKTESVLSHTKEDDEALKHHMNKAVHHFTQARKSKDKEKHMKHFNHHAGKARDIIAKADKQGHKSNVIHHSKNLLRLMGAK